MSFQSSRTRDVQANRIDAKTVDYGRMDIIAEGQPFFRRTASLEDLERGSGALFGSFDLVRRAQVRPRPFERVLGKANDGHH
jgi:hypothetical protein